MPQNHTGCQLVPISKLNPHPDNPNKHSASQIEQLADIIEYQGWRKPITVSNPTGFITAGHGRLLAAKLKKWTELPVSHQDYEDYAQEYADLVADNAIAAQAEIDMALINTKVPDLGPELDVRMLGFENFEIEPADKYEGRIEDDEIPVVKETRVKLGELWQLDEHRLLCGDCTVKENVDRLMGGNEADMLFTDPPYGIDVAGSDGKIGEGKKCVSKKYGDIIGDTKEFDATFLINIPAVTRFLFGGNYFAHTLPRSTHWLVWNKNSRDEHVRANDFSDCELIWTNIKRTSTPMYRHGWSGMFMSGKRKDEGGKKLHPTQKPVGLIESIFKDYEARSVIDLFLGSGSTLIACQKTGRKCYGLEIDPHYCSIILARWEEYTGKKAEKIG